MSEPDPSALLSLDVDNEEEVHCELSTDGDDSLIGAPTPATGAKGKDLYLDEEDTAYEYILGTLIVRVVAARDLEAANKSGIGRMIFGAGGSAHDYRGGRNSNRSSGTSNPYASVRFGTTAQRTSEVYGTLDPIWPRGEAMYMDVVHREPINIVSTPAGADIRQFTGLHMEGATPTDPFAKEGSISAQTSATAHPGDPPKKPHANSKTASLKTEGLSATASASNDFLSLPENCQEQDENKRPVLTIAVFHANNNTAALTSKFPTKNSAGDSDDMFLGAAEVDLTTLITGKLRSFDEWLPLLGSNSDRATIRVVCEYETSDAPPQQGDLVKFTDFCHQQDIFPARPDRIYTVTEVMDADQLLISWTSPEGWISTYEVHRFMLICVKRRHSMVDACQDELASIRERISHSPMIHAVQDTLEKVPEEGLISVSADLIGNSVSLLQRWWEGGIERTAEDLQFATNWDGRNNPVLESLSTALESPLSNASGKEEPTYEEEEFQGTILPNMPPCPITGEPMRDPVVAADGHTYERSAIARWLLESNKSPLTGAILVHKDLVPNYMLLTSLQEAAKLSSAPPNDSPQMAEVNIAPEDEDEEDITAEVSLSET